jgi:hypothetical protein
MFSVCKISKYWFILFKIEVNFFLFYLIQWLFRSVYTPTCCWICYSCFFFFLDEKVLLLHVVYEKYNYLLSMNFNDSIHIKDTHKMTSIHIKDTYRITSIHIKDTYWMTTIHIILRHIQNTCIHIKVFYVNAIVILFVNVMVEKILQPYPYLSHNVNINICKCW